MYKYKYIGNIIRKQVYIDVLLLFFLFFLTLEMYSYTGYFFHIRVIDKPTAYYPEDDNIRL